MSSPFNADLNSCNPDNGAHSTVGPRSWGYAMSLDKLRKHTKIFEKKVLNTSAKKSRTPFKSKEQDETAEDLQQGPIDPQFAIFCPMKSFPISSKPSPPAPDFNGPGHLAAAINLSESSTMSPDTSCISSLKNTVVIFGFLSKLEAHIENSGNVIIVRWVARTKKSYFFLKKKIGSFSKNLEQRLNKKVATGARYRKQAPKRQQ